VFLHKSYHLQHFSSRSPMWSVGSTNHWVSVLVHSLTEIVSRPSEWKWMKIINVFTLSLLTHSLCFHTKATICSVSPVGPPCGLLDPQVTESVFWFNSRVPCISKHSQSNLQWLLAQFCDSKLVGTAGARCTQFVGMSQCVQHACGLSWRGFVARHDRNNSKMTQLNTPLVSQLLCY